MGHEREIVCQVFKLFNIPYDLTINFHINVHRSFNFSHSNWKLFCASANEWINNCRIFVQWITTKQYKLMKYWYANSMDVSQITSTKKIRKKVIHTEGFHLYKILDIQTNI